MGVASRKPSEGGNGSAAGTGLSPRRDARAHAETSADVFVSAQLAPTAGGTNNTLIFHHWNHSGEEGPTGGKWLELFWKEEREGGLEGEEEEGGRRV